MARGEMPEHCRSLDATVMAAGPCGGLAALEGDTVFGSSAVRPSSTIHSRSTPGRSLSGVDGGVLGVPMAQRSPLGRVERDAARSPAHAYASTYSGVRVPEHLRDALNRLGCRT